MEHPRFREIWRECLWNRQKRIIGPGPDDSAEHGRLNEDDLAELRRILGRMQAFVVETNPASIAEWTEWSEKHRPTSFKLQLRCDCGAEVTLTSGER